jgi:SAM-dependent methyltransferase
MTGTTDTEKRFDFGKNWKQFVQKSFSQERVEASKRHILEFLKVSHLHGLTFLDIGCGSGLHSLAALQAGAASIVSFDRDPKSVEATRVLYRIAGQPTNWQILQGSVLDEAFMGSLGRADVVYSWGVLHHTGDVWRATRSAAGRVKDGGLFYIALYSADVQIDPPPQFWLDVKQKYNSSSWFTKRRMELWYIWRFDSGPRTRHLRRFLARTLRYKQNRGMSRLTDIRDWLGGWPMQFVYDAEAIQFCKQLGFELVNIATGQANTEFLFRKSG